MKEDYLETYHQLLSERLEGHSCIYYTRDLIEQGLFGPLPASTAFLKRVGNLAILPLDGQAVFWHEASRFNNRLCGNHGGLSRDEMETVFLFLDSAVGDE